MTIALANGTLPLQAMLAEITRIEGELRRVSDRDQRIALQSRLVQLKAQLQQKNWSGA